MFLHTLPHLLAEETEPTAEHRHDREIIIGLSTLAGFAIFMLVSNVHSYFIRALLQQTRQSERLISLSLPHSHSHQDDHKVDDKSATPSNHTGVQMGAQGWLNLAADAMHNFTDGLAIGVAYSFGQGKALGFATLLGTFFHEIPHEFADFTILVTNGLSKFQAIRMQFVTAVAAMIGTAAGTLLSENSEFLREILMAATAGGFVYIATIGALVSVLSSKRKLTASQVVLEVLLFALGVGMMVAIAMSEEHDHSHGHSHSAAHLQSEAPLAHDHSHHHHEHHHQHR